MVGYRIDFSQDQQSNANGDAYSGGKLYCYTNETTTLVTLYSDAAGTVTAANPIVADSAGRLPVRYVGADDPLTLSFKTSADVLVWSMDDFEPVPNIANAALADYLPLAGGTMTGALRFKEGDALTSATSINLDASGGNFNHLDGVTPVATLTLQQGAVRWIICNAATPFTHSANLLLGGVSFTAHAGMILCFMGEGAGVTRLIGGMTASGKSIVESVALVVGIGDETTAITTGTNKRRFRAPFAFTITAARASLATAQASGTVVTVDINNAGNSVFSTVLTVDNNETTSTTAATPSVLNATYVDVADDALLAFDIDACDGSTAAAGLKAALIGYKFNLS